MFIRTAQDADIASLYDLYRTIGVKADGYFERCLAEQAEGRRDVLLALADEDAAAGYGMLNWQPQYALYRRLGIPEIQDLNVNPAARRQGIASALVDECEARARARGCGHIGISVGVHSSYGPAQRLYAKKNYIPDGCGVTYDRTPVSFGEIRPVDDELCLMLVKAL